MSADIVITEPRRLYPYQKVAVDTLFERLQQLPPNTNLLFQLPTGGGKTIIFSEIAKRYAEGFNRKVLILTHRIELSRQTSDVLFDLGINNKVINSEVKTLPSQSPYKAFIALVETLNNRLQENEEFLLDTSFLFE